MKPLQNQIALVSGASRGIGQAIALELARQGAQVAGTATTDQGAAKITQLFAQENLNGQGFILNVTEAASITQTLAAIKTQWGAPSILINNAGITRDNLMLRMKDDEWDSVLATNLSAIFHLTKLCLKDMLKARFGRIISIGSVVGSAGSAGQANYAAAKAGLVGFSKSLAQEIATRNVTVNVIAPGFIESDMTAALNDEQKAAILARIPSARFGQPADVAYACAFLAAPIASYITGQTLHVNGGMFME
jgi:3-oxoacyl-[acyl-carrier protein] reductase